MKTPPILRPAALHAVMEYFLYWVSSRDENIAQKFLVPMHVRGCLLEFDYSRNGKVYVVKVFNASRTHILGTVSRSPGPPSTFHKQVLGHKVA